MHRRSLLLAVTASLAASRAYAQGAAGGEPVKIGAIEILSGPNAAYGTAIRDGLLLAQDEINAKGGRKLDLVVEDSAGNKDQAINAARKLIGRDHVSLIIGPTISNEMFAVGPVVNERKIPIVGTSTTAVGITDIGPWVFRTSLPESDVLPVVLAYVKSRGVKSIAFMFANDDAFSKSSYETMRAAAQKSGLQVLADEAFGQKDTDFSAQLTKIRGLKPDAIGIGALVEPTSGVLLQARQLGFGPETTFIGGNGSNSPKVGEIAGKAANGLIVGSPWFAGKKDPANQRFVQAFQAKYGHAPDQFAAQAYDTLHIVAEAVERAGGAQNDKLREALLATKHDGVMGPFTFTDHRDPGSTEGVVVLVMQDGKFSEAPKA